MNFTGKQRKQLMEAFVNAFPSRDSLAQMVHVVLNQNLEAITGGTSLVDVVFNLFQWAEARGKLEILIRGAYEENPNNPLLKEFVEHQMTSTS